jgi:menaquinone-dependent protoporphyrinogen oxidase
MVGEYKVSRKQIINIINIINMKTAIIYYSKKGTTQKVAKIISEKLNSEEDLINLKQNTPLNISSYDRIIIGTPIYAGNSSKKVKKFIVANLNHLQKKEIGLYVCGMEKEEEKQREELERAYPKELIDKAKSKQFLGGEFLFENMNFFERMIIKKIAKTDKSISEINQHNIDKFVQELS